MSQPVFLGPAWFVLDLTRFSGVLLCEWVPCFTALRVSGIYLLSIGHAYASDAVLGKSREHVLISGFLEVTHF